MGRKGQGHQDDEHPVGDGAAEQHPDLGPVALKHLKTDSYGRAALPSLLQAISGVGDARPDSPDDTRRAAGFRGRLAAWLHGA